MLNYNGNGKLDQFNTITFQYQKVVLCSQIEKYRHSVRIKRKLNDFRGRAHLLRDSVSLQRPFYSEQWSSKAFTSCSSFKCPSTPTRPASEVVKQPFDSSHSASCRIGSQSHYSARHIASQKAAPKGAEFIKTC